MLDAINVMLSANCPSEIPSTENINVFFSSDFEDGSTVSTNDIDNKITLMLFCNKAVHTVHEMTKLIFQSYFPQSIKIKYRFLSVNQLSGNQVTDSEAFCGRRSLRNPSCIFEIPYPYNAVPLKIYNTVRISKISRISSVPVFELFSLFWKLCSLR